MSSDPNQIDELLRAAARQREGQHPRPFELSSANREELQAEVAKAFPDGDAGKQQFQRSFWRALWPRLLFGGSVFALLALTFTLMNRRDVTHGEFQVALKQDSIIDPSSPPQPSPARPTKTRSAPSRAEANQVENAVEHKLTVPSGAPREVESVKKVAEADKVDGFKETLVRQKALEPPQAKAPAVTPPPPAAPAPRALEIANAPEPAPAPPAPATLPDERPALTYQVADRTQSKTESAKDLAAVTPALNPAVPSASAALANVQLQGSAEGGNETRFYRFQNAPGPLGRRETPTTGRSLGRSRIAKPAAASQTSQILDNFQIEQQGQKVRVLDNDGSLYLGTLQLTQAAPGIAKAKTESTDAAKPQAEFAAPVLRQRAVATDNSQNVQTYFLQATGVNQTLRQEVVLKANMAVPIPDVAANQTRFMTTPATSGPTPAQTAPLKPQQALANQSTVRSQAAQLNGRAIIAETNEIHLNAVSVER